MPEHEKIVQANTKRELALRILCTKDPHEKARLALSYKVGTRRSQPQDQTAFSELQTPERPARASWIREVPPAKVPARKPGIQTGRISLLHAIAHIELNAIDLAFDMIARFGFTEPVFPGWTSEFCNDWLRIGQEEAKHFKLITDLLAKRDVNYGDLPVHAGMWDAALATSDRVDARLAIAPLVLEARGLDVTPPMIAKLKQVGDFEAVDVLEVIYAEEVGHVAIGVKWFERICRELNVKPETHFKHLLATRYTSTLKPPFNVEAREQAGLVQGYYQ